MLLEGSPSMTLSHLSTVLRLENCGYREASTIVDCTGTHGRRPSPHRARTGVEAGVGVPAGRGADGEQLADEVGGGDGVQVHVEAGERRGLGGAQRRDAQRQQQQRGPVVVLAVVREGLEVDEHRRQDLLELWISVRF
jgi:hypothetical protein